MAQVRIYLCQPCAAKLREVLAKKGEDAMARAIARVLCLPCRSKIPGYSKGRRLETRLKARPS